MLPAFPKVMMLVKNLKIILNNTISEQEILTQNMLINFGPLFLKKQLFINKSTSEKFLKAVTNKESINSDQLNYMRRKTVQNVTLDANVDANQQFKPVVVEKPVLSGFSGDTERMTKPVATAVFSNKENFTARASLKDKSLVASTLFINPGLFTPLPFPVPATTSTITFYFTDKVNAQPSYKCALSI